MITVQINCMKRTLLSPLQCAKYILVELIRSIYCSRFKVGVVNHIKGSGRMNKEAFHLTARYSWLRKSIIFTKLCFGERIVAKQFQMLSPRSVMREMQLKQTIHLGNWKGLPQSVQFLLYFLAYRTCWSSRRCKNEKYKIQLTFWQPSTNTKSNPSPGKLRFM